MPELLEQYLHPAVSPLHSTQQITKEKAVEFIFTPKILFSTTKFSLQKIIETQETRQYTDGSKTDEGTGSTYFILEHYGIIASLQNKLNHNNLDFQAEILAIKMGIEAASSL
ncbi:hypothetical protein AVEN_265695-1 [Araneus ventricosus]|uniref:RNase H type-1 domain-containing protein n=1 Tax=Araneus ventricosus TaxID=182803 RepID=A0A4Y2N6D8_ARAVE|nr:hypothetical protein AVEN_265695-1 [Araneus ventricosus]